MSGFDAAVYDDPELSPFLQQPEPDVDEVNAELQMAAAGEVVTVTSWDPAESPRDAEPNGLPALSTAEGQTDLTNARRLVAMYGDNIRFCHQWNRWLLWDHTRWAVDSSGGIKRLGKAVADAIWRAAGILDDNASRRWAARSASENGIGAMLSLAASEVPIEVEEMDANPWLLNCPNGTVDLRTGELRAHNRADCITQLCPVEYDPDAKADRWEQFQHEVTDGDAELIGYKHRFYGHTLTGIVQEQILPIAFGVGSNGKSVEADTISAAMGPDYCGTMPRSMLMVQKGSEHPTALTTLFRKRLMIGHETDDGGRLSEALVKQLTGGDTITARGMRQDFWEFRPTHKLLLLTNHRPAVRGSDHAIWRRLRLLPYTVRFDGDRRDKLLPEKLQAELPGILAWLVRGCIEWQRQGLNEPESVLAATAEYRVSEDVVGQFVEETCIVQPSVRVRASHLYAAYKRWAESAGEYVQSQRKFGTAMTERGFQREHSGGTWYVGIGLLDTRSQEPEL